MAAAMFATAHAQPATSCDDEGLRPISGDVLDPYYVRSGGVGGLGCWVHKHSNGVDLVVTPHNWGREPTPGKRMLIEGALETITLARAKVTEIGGAQTWPLHVVLNDSDTHPNAKWPVNSRCWIVAGSDARDALGSWRGEFSNTYKQMIAHEVGHCFIMENIPGYSAATYSARNARWWDESAATYFSELVYPVMNQEHVSARRFDLDGAPFVQEYSAFILFDYLIDSPSELWQLLRKFHNTTNPGELRALFRANGWDRRFHDFVVDHYSSRVRDMGCGAGGACTYPREPNVEPAYLQALVEDEQYITPWSLLPGLLNIAEVDIPAEYDLVLPKSVETVRPGFYGSIVGGAPETKYWADGTTVTGSCDGDRTVLLALTHFGDADVTDMKIPFELVRRTCAPSCSEDSVDRCLIGKWRLDNASLSAMGMSPPTGSLVFEVTESGGLVAEFDLQSTESRARAVGAVRACVAPGSALGAEAGLGPNASFFSFDGAISEVRAGTTEPELTGLALSQYLRMQYLYSCTSPSTLTFFGEITFSRVGPTP
jgi:hypothetical protein